MKKKHGKRLRGGGMLDSIYNIFGIGSKTEQSKDLTQGQVESTQGSVTGQGPVVPEKSMVGGRKRKTNKRKTQKSR